MPAAVLTSITQYLLSDLSEQQAMVFPAFVLLLQFSDPLQFFYLLTTHSDLVALCQTN